MYFIEDEDIARNLQRKLNSSSVDSPKIVYEKENVKLTDSRLEYNDPTPNIHELFVLFDRKFFWGTLGMVEVKWSNRMTTCAGLCYYQGKRGLCSIKLSAPLLSLRPRKDLVETLLHEMIHAYLFITGNYRDRDDHGPEFRKHMNRINKEAGTNITIYHTFLDEVAYYQKHIWRCNGPCQHRKPYFGFVRRAMNRAPGPNDHWWRDHQNSCGGTFIKVSEPQKTCKKKAGHEKDKSPKGATSVKDIRDYFSPECPSKRHSPVNNKEHTSKSSNIYTISDLNRISSPVNNNLKSVSQNFIIPKIEKTDGSESQTKSDIFINDRKEINPDNSNVQATVRNAWANKYPGLKSPLKRPNSTILNSSAEKTTEVKRREVTCPVCCMSFSEDVINEHVDQCLLKQSAEPSVEKLPVDEVANSVNKPPSVLEAQHEKENPGVSLAQCPVCGEPLKHQDLKEHLDLCLTFTFKNEIPEKEDETDSVPCPCCMKWVQEKVINVHIDECLTFIALKNSVKCY